MVKHADFDRDRMSLCEVLDRVLNTGVVIVGDIVISVAGIDLIYLGLQLTLTSVETANGNGLALTPRMRSAFHQESV